jgi:hypothetical protein
MGPLDDEFVDDVRKRVKEQKAKRKMDAILSAMSAATRWLGGGHTTPHRRPPHAVDGPAGGVGVAVVRERRSKQQAKQKKSSNGFYTDTPFGRGKSIAFSSSTKPNEVRAIDCRALPVYS